jgi:hypothetical protein
MANCNLEDHYQKLTIVPGQVDCLLWKLFEAQDEAWKDEAGKVHHNLKDNDWELTVVPEQYEHPL